MIRAQKYLAVARAKLLEAIEGQALKPYQQIDIKEFELLEGEKKVIHVYIHGIDICSRLEFSRENIRFLIDMNGATNYALDGLHPYDDQFAGKLERFVELITKAIRLKEDCQEFNSCELNKRDIA